MCYIGNMPEIESRVANVQSEYEQITSALDNRREKLEEHLAEQVYTPIEYLYQFYIYISTGNCIEKYV